MRYLFIGLAMMLQVGVAAQGEVGLSAGAGFFMFEGYRKSAGEAEHSMKLPAMSLSVCVRQNAQPVGFALHVGYLYKAISGKWYQGGQGAHESRNGDFSMHVLRIVMAPEFATDSTDGMATRFGLETRLAFAGRFKGRAAEYNMNPQYGPNYSSEDTTMSVGGLEVLVFLGMRITASANDRYVTTVEPYIAYAPISHMVDGGPNTRWFECGLALGVGRRVGKARKAKPGTP